MVRHNNVYNNAQLSILKVGLVRAQMGPTQSAVFYSLAAGS